jgi:hypothetical protein
MRYVLFKEDPNTHGEVYLRHVDTLGFPHQTGMLERAARFDSAAEAYAFGVEHQPYLQWWRVGLR